MGDVGDDYAAWKLASKARRANNRLLAPKLLRDAGIPFTSHNGGAHLIVAGEWHFWPGTGKWNHRGPPFIFGQTTESLIERIRADKKDKETPDGSS